MSNCKICTCRVELLQQFIIFQINFFQLVDRLKLCTHRCQYTPQQPIAEMKRIINLLGKAFKKLVNKMLTKELKVSFI